MWLRDLSQLLKEAAEAWLDDGATRLSSSLAYYAIFSLAPLLVIVIAIAGLVYGEQAAQGQIAQQISALAGARAAEAIQMLVQSSAESKGTGILASSLGLVVLIFGASTVFAELKDALNTVWGVVVKPGCPVWSLVRARLKSFLAVLGIGFVLLASLLVSATISAAGKLMGAVLPVPKGVWYGVDFLVSFAVISVLFAMVFKMLPSVRIRWRDVAVGAVGTAFLFTVGKFLIGLYLGRSGIASGFGAAGSLVVLLAWIYYSACILFFGAEFTKVYACKFGGGVVPRRNAELLRDVLCAKYKLVPPSE